MAPVGPDFAARTSLPGQGVFLIMMFLQVALALVRQLVTVKMVAFPVPQTVPAVIVGVSGCALVALVWCKTGTFVSVQQLFASPLAPLVAPFADRLMAAAETAPVQMPARQLYPPLLLPLPLTRCSELTGKPI